MFALWLSSQKGDMMRRSRYRLLSSAAMVVALLASTATSAWAGNIFITGHDDDFHDADGSSGGKAQLGAAISYARNGSALPVLTFDAGSELTSDLTALGISFTNVNPNVSASVTDSLFNYATYSAFIVASDTTCGGCDNSAVGEANLATHSSAINGFLNAGGGIIGLAGANSPLYYAFLPQTATSVGGAPSSGYSQTAAGGAAGIPAVNGDETHNLFYTPGTNGESAAYQIAEINATTGNGTILPPAAVSLICTACTTSGGTLIGGGGNGGTTVPEPASFAVLAAGIAGVGFGRRNRAKSS